MSIENRFEEHTAQDRETFEKLSDELAALRRDMLEVKLALQNQKGFFAGIVFVVSALAAVITLGIAWIKG